MRDSDRMHMMSGTLDTTGSGGEESVLSGVAHVFKHKDEPSAQAVETELRWTPEEGWVEGPAGQVPLFDDDGQPDPSALPEQPEQPDTAQDGDEDQVEDSEPDDPEVDGEGQEPEDPEGSEQEPPADPGGPVVSEADAAKSRRAPATTGKGRQGRGPKAAG